MLDQNVCQTVIHTCNGRLIKSKIYRPMFYTHEIKINIWKYRAKKRLVII